LDAIEKAVRNALEKGDTEDKNFRRRVYVSARHALEKSMKGKKIAQRVADDKFARLSEVAASIETEFSAAEEAEDYVPAGRRSYEAAAPQVDEIAENGAAETEEAVISEEAPFAEAAPEPEMEQAPQVIEEAVTSFEPEPLEPQTAALEAIVAELTPQPGEKSAKPAKKPLTRKKSAKKSIVEEVAPAIETSDSGPDLFEKSEPDWKEVSLPSQYDTLPEPETEQAPAASADPEAEELPAREAEPRPDMPSEEPQDDSEQDLEDLRALDDVRFEDMKPFDDNAAIAKAADTRTPAPAEKPANEQKYEVRPAAAAETEAIPVPDKARQRPELRRGWAFLFILITLLAFFVMALWIAFSTGALKIRGAAVEPEPQAVTVAPVDEPQPTAENPAAPPVSDDWMMIFRPDNPGDLVVDPTIKADMTGQGPLARLRIEPAQSTTGDAAVVFSIGQGILQQVAGKKAVFDIVAAADKGKPTQISVLCDFAGLGDCGRKRYQIDDATSDNLFQIEFPSGSPEGAGQIILNPDVDGKGRSLEIYAIKVRVTN
jgi:hypothetical protein